MNLPGDAINVITRGGLEAAARNVGSAIAEANDAYGHLSCVLKLISTQIQADTAAVQHETRLAALKDAWEKLDSTIKRGPLPGNGWDQTSQNNGVILAANILAAMLKEEMDR